MSRRSRKRARTKVSMYRRDMPLSPSRIDGRRRYFSESREYRSRPYQAIAWTPRYKKASTKPHPLSALVVSNRNYLPRTYSPVVHSEFNIPVANKSILCGRRQIRKEVLFANRVAGRSGGSPGKNGTYRRNEGSKITCS